MAKWFDALHQIAGERMLGPGVAQIGGERGGVSVLVVGGGGRYPKKLIARRFDRQGAPRGTGSGRIRKNKTDHALHAARR